MSFNRSRAPQAFTLVEIMIVVAIIALLAAIAVPNFMRARKRSQATRILNDVRLLDNAVNQYAMDHNTPDGTFLYWSDLKNYIKTGTQLYTSEGYDILGGMYNIQDDAVFPLGHTVRVDPNTFNALSDVAPAEFWSPYY